MGDDMQKDARISEDGAYRYTLSRQWDPEGPEVLWVMLNPSTADGSEDDPTIRKIIKFSQRDGFGRLTVVNLFARRSSKPSALYEPGDHVGPENDAVIVSEVKRVVAGGGSVVCAWGAWLDTNRNHVDSSAVHRDREVWDLILAHCGEPKSLRPTKTGQPGHPLYLRDETPIALYTLP